MFLFDDDVETDEGRWFFEKDAPSVFRFTFAETEQLGALVIKGKNAFDAVAELIAEELGWNWDGAGQAELLALSDRADMAITRRLAIPMPATTRLDHAIDEFIALHHRYCTLIDGAGRRFDQ